MVANCLWCEKPLTGKQLLYCSYAHGKKANKKRRRTGLANYAYISACDDRPCQRCGNTMIAPLPGRKFCLDCRPRYLPKYRFECSVCNIKMSRRQLFCSTTCRNFARKPPKKPVIEFNCQRCGQLFTSSHANSKWCSNACYEKAHKELYYSKHRERKRELSRAHYFAANELKKKRERRATRTAAIEAYHELLGLNKLPKVRVQFGTPIVKIGEWRSYLILPSPIRLQSRRTYQGGRGHQFHSKWRKWRRNWPLITLDDEWMSYIVLPQGQWMPKARWQVGRPHAGTYSQNYKLFSSHFRELITHRRNSPEGKARRQKEGKRWREAQGEKYKVARRIRECEKTNLVRAMKNLDLIKEGIE